MTTKNPVLARTSFESGADETLATPDIYGGNTPDTPIGAMRDSINEGNSISIPGIGDGFGGLGELLSQDMASFSAAYGKYEQGIKAVTSVLNGDKSLIENLKTNMVGDLLTSAGFGKTATQLAGSLINGDNPMDIVGSLAKANPNLRLIVDGIETVVGAKDIDSIEDLLAVAGKLSGMEGLGDLLQIGPQLGIIKGLVDKANFLGIPELANSLMKTIKDPSDKKKVELGASLGAAQGGNLTMLKDIIGKHGAAAVSGMYPQMVGQILSSYRYPTDKKYATVSEANNLISICNELDKDWMHENRESNRVISMRYLTTVSKDAKELLYLLDSTREATMVASKYPSTSLMGLAQRQYPYTPMAIT